MPIAPRERRGVVLVDVLVAVTMLGTAGVFLAAHVAETRVALRSYASREEQVRMATSMLAAHVIMRPATLRGRIGESVAGRFRVTIRESQPLLFEVTISDGATGTEILGTTIYPAEGHVREER